MTGERRLILKLASHLLQYPDAALLATFDSLTPVIQDLSPGPAREAIAGFLRNFGNWKLLHWQEEYTRHFDLNPATSLNLTYHKYGDGKERGPALAQLQRVYQKAGYEAVPGELPDFLPLVLEFLAVCPEVESTWLLQEYQPQIETLANGLKEAETPYAKLFSVIVDTWRIDPA